MLFLMCLIPMLASVTLLGCTTAVMREYGLSFALGQLFFAIPLFVYGLDLSLFVITHAVN